MEWVNPGRRDNRGDSRGKDHLEAAEPPGPPRVHGHSYPPAPRPRSTALRRLWRENAAACLARPPRHAPPRVGGAGDAGVQAAVADVDHQRQLPERPGGGLQQEVVAVIDGGELLAEISRKAAQDVLIMAGLLTAEP